MKILLKILSLCMILFSCEDNGQVLIDIGCIDSSACNHNENAVLDDNSCIYPAENYDCDGNCLVNIDCYGVCGGTAIVDCNGVCNGGDTDCDQQICDSCYYDFSNYGSECCDTAWYEYGVNCASLESNYSWNCNGCQCPGDQGNDECSEGNVSDCSGDGDCCPEGWIGDGLCDGADQQWGCDLTCYNNDGGDCNWTSKKSIIYLIFKPLFDTDKIWKLF